MAKMILMKGLPASGKSTKAKELLLHGNTVRLNKDLLRTMLHFDKWNGVNESLTRDAARRLAITFLQSGTNVIIDDTNLNEGTLQSWKDLAKELEAKIEYHVMDTPIDECIKRDIARENAVGRDVIIGMALTSGLYPKPAKGFVLCDLDGTLADIKHRLNFVRDLPEGQKKDWKSFFEGIPGDSVRTEVMDMLTDFEDKGHEIILVSARPDNYREETEAWLEKIFKGYRLWTTLIMRRAGDRRPDTETKQQILDTYFKKNSYPIHCVIDDRPSVIEMWRGNGIDVIDVGTGEEF